MYVPVNFEKKQEPDAPDDTRKKPMKYYEKQAVKNDSNHFDGHGTVRTSVEKESKLQRSEMTQFKVPQELGTLPLPTTSGRGVQNPSLTQEMTREQKSCQPASENFYERSFSIFQAQPDIGKHVQKSVDFRQGISSRNMNKTIYKSA